MCAPNTEPGLPFSLSASSIVRLCVLRVMRCAEIITLLLFRNLARARERLSPPPPTFPLPEAACDGAEVGGRGSSSGGEVIDQHDALDAHGVAANVQRGELEVGGRGSSSGGEVEACGGGGVEDEGGAEVRTARAARAERAARAARAASWAARWAARWVLVAALAKVAGAAARAAKGARRAAGATRAAQQARARAAARVAAGARARTRGGSSLVRLAPSGVPCVGEVGLWVRCSAKEDKLASSSAPVRADSLVEPSSDCADDEATDHSTDCGGGLALRIGKEAGEARPSASTAAASEEWAPSSIETRARLPCSDRASISLELSSPACSPRRRNEDGDPPRRTEATKVCGRRGDGELGGVEPPLRTEARRNEARPREAWEPVGEGLKSFHSGEPRTGERGGEPSSGCGGREGRGEPRSHSATKERSVSSVKSRSKTARQGW
eukprot:scaffold8291_cov64-Phaeocystis_antarctica.AAC.9